MDTDSGDTVRPTFRTVDDLTPAEMRTALRDIQQSIQQGFGPGTADDVYHHVSETLDALGLCLNVSS